MSKRRGQTPPLGTATGQADEAPLSGLLPSEPREPKVQPLAERLNNRQPQQAQHPEKSVHQGLAQPPQKKVKKTASCEDVPASPADRADPTPARNAPPRANTPPPASRDNGTTNWRQLAGMDPREQERAAAAEAEAKAAKRAKRAQSPAPAAPAPAPVPAAQAQPVSSSQQRHRERERPSSGEHGIAWVLSEVRGQLEAMADVDGVRQQLDQFPECILLGGISARRELVASLLGEHAHAMSAASALVAPGMRQPIAVELRCSPNSKQGLNLSSFKGPEADAWLSSVTQAVHQGLGTRLKVDSLRLRLSAAGCANLDLVDLPEKGIVAGQPIPPKIEEMRVRHLSCNANLIVCLEAGQALDLARRFDPQLKRTVLLGAAAVAMGNNGILAPLPSQTLCGPAAARALEERFMKMCHERAPKWITGMENLETRLTKTLREAQQVAHAESSCELLSRARSAGLSFGRALQHVVGGTPCCTTGALTLEEELLDFASAAAASTCGFGAGLTGKQAAEAAEEVWASFGGIEGYITYLREKVCISSADVALNGGSSWYRLMEEIEVAMRLVHPSAQDLKELAICAVQAGGTGIRGHQRWDDVSAKLLLEMAYEPLRRRVRYVAARVNWALQQQKLAVAEWMAAVEEGPASRLYSPLFAEHLGVLKQSPIARDLVFEAFDKASNTVAETLLLNLEGTLSAMCLNPKIMLRPTTEPDKDVAMKKPLEGKQIRNRVKEEMRRRSGPSGGGLPGGLRDLVFDPREAKKALPSVEQDLCRAFKMLSGVLANQAFAFADTSLSALCRRNIDEAMNAIQFSAEQQRALDSREAELQATATQARERLDKVRRCLTSLKSARLLR